MVHLGTGKKTENTLLAEKVHLRSHFLPNKEVVDVLDAFTADGIIWKAVEKLNPDKSFRIARVDKESKKEGFYVRSENIRFLRSTDLGVYDVIDLDHFGIPFEQLEILFRYQFTSPVEVFVTMNLIGIRRMPKRLLAVLGYSKRMIEASISLCSKHNEKKLFGYLNLRGVREVNKISFDSGSGYHLYCHFTLGRRE